MLGTQWGDADVNLSLVLMRQFVEGLQEPCAPKRNLLANGA
jgi:hypothetical protein